MRIRIPRRFLLLGILLCSLAVAAASVPHTAYAKPIPWNGEQDPNDPTPKGDGDGPVVKAASIGVAPGTSEGARVRTFSSVTQSGMWRIYLAVLRLGFGWTWYR